MSDDVRSLLTGGEKADAWDVLWRLLASARLTAFLFLILALFLVVSVFLPGGSDLRADAWTLRGPGSFDLRQVPDSILLRLILGGLALNSLVVVADRWPLSWRRLRDRFPIAPERNVGQVALVETTLAASTEQAAARLREALEGRGFSCRVDLPNPDEAGKGACTWAADRFPWGWAAALFFPLGILLLLLGLALSGSFSWREGGIALAPGQTHGLQQTALALRLDEVDREGYSRLSLLLPGSDEGDGTAVVGSGLVRPGQMFDAFGLTFFQEDYRPAARLWVTDSAGSPLTLQLFPAHASQSGYARVSFPAERNEVYLTVPDRALSLRLVFYSSLPEEAGPVFLVEFYKADRLEPSYHAFAHSGDAVSFGGVRCELTVEYDAVLGATWNPGAWLVLPGALLLVLGLFFLTVASPVKLWGSVEAVPGNRAGQEGEGAGEVLMTLFGESLSGKESLRRRLAEVAAGLGRAPDGQEAR